MLRRSEATNVEGNVVMQLVKTRSMVARRLNQLDEEEANMFEVLRLNRELGSLRRTMGDKPEPSAEIISFRSYAKKKGKGCKKK